MCDCAEQIHGRLIVRKIQDDRSDFVWTFGKRAQRLLLGRGVHEFTPATGRGMLNRQVALGIVDSNDKEGFHVTRLRREEIPRLGIDWHSLCGNCATAQPPPFPRGERGDGDAWIQAIAGLLGPSCHGQP